MNMFVGIYFEFFTEIRKFRIIPQIIEIIFL